MNDIKLLTEIDYSQVFLGIFGILVGTYGIYMILSKICDSLGIEFGWQRRNREFKEKISATSEEVYNIKQIIAQNKLESDTKDAALESSIAKISDMLGDFIEEENKRTVSSYRATIYSLHRTFMRQGYVTEEGLKTFVECCETYEKAGGNDIVHGKLKPEVMKLPILSDPNAPINSPVQTGQTSLNI